LGTSPIHHGGVENQRRDVLAAFDVERRRAVTDQGGGGVSAEGFAVFRAALWERGESSE
jgi:hypothetical protein